MKLSTLSEKILKFMVLEYKSSNREYFSFDDIKSEFLNFDDDLLSKAIYSMQDNGFVSVFSADDVAYGITLLVDGIISCEENTPIKKGYSVLKELKNLLS